MTRHWSEPRERGMRTGSGLKTSVYRSLTQLSQLLQLSPRLRGSIPSMAASGQTTSLTALAKSTTSVMTTCETSSHTAQRVTKSGSSWVNVHRVSDQLGMLTTRYPASARNFDDLMIKVKGDIPRCLVVLSRWCLGYVLCSEVNVVCCGEVNITTTTTAAAAAAVVVAL